MHYSGKLLCTETQPNRSVFIVSSGLTPCYLTCILSNNCRFINKTIVCFSSFCNLNLSDVENIQENLQKLGNWIDEAMSWDKNSYDRDQGSIWISITRWYSKG